LADERTFVVDVDAAVDFDRELEVVFVLGIEEILDRVVVVVILLEFIMNIILYSYIVYSI